MTDFERVRLMTLLSAATDALDIAQTAPQRIQVIACLEVRLRTVKSIGEKMLDADKAERDQAERGRIREGEPFVPPAPPARATEASHGKGVGERLGNLGEGA
jgi:hypothetical protein